MCPDKCDVVVTINDGKITRVDPDQDSPRGRVCKRGAMAPKIIYSEKRIRTPLIRDGERGSGKFRKATWEEAWDVAAEGFRKVYEKYGARALVSYIGGSGREDAIMRCFRGKDAFFSQLGSPNDMGCGSICNVSSNFITPVTTYGLPTFQIVQDIEHSEVVFVWGKNSKTDSGPLFTLQAIKEAKKRGAVLVVIDPRGEGMAEMADYWIPIVPGSDGALAIAMLKLIVEEEWYDKEFVENYTRGFGEFSVYLKSVTLEEMSGYCGVSVEQIRNLTELFMSTEKISLVSYTGLEYQLSGVQNNQAIQTLWAITGKLDVEGGICFAAENAVVMEMQEMRGKERAVGAEKYPLFSRLTGSGQFVEVPKAVLRDDPYPVRGMLITASSPAVTYPQQNLWHEVYKKLECLVVLDRFMTEDAKYADVIFPATTLFENQSVVAIPGGIRMRNRLAEPVGEAKNDVFILQGIAERLGFGECYPKTDEELELWMVDGDVQKLNFLKENEYGIVKQQQLKYQKYKTGELRQDGKPGFPTPSGKFEISSVHIEECGYEGYPRYEDIRSIKELGSKEEYPLMLTTAARNGVRFSSFGPVIPEIAEMEPVPTIDIGKNDAEKYGVKDGETAEIETVFGKQQFIVRICKMAEGCIHIAYGAGSSYMEGEWKRHNVNDICSMEYSDPLSGFLTFKSLPCRIRKVETNDVYKKSKEI